MSLQFDHAPPPREPRPYEVVGAGAETAHTRMFAYAAAFTIWSVVVATLLLTVEAFAKTHAWRQAANHEVPVSVALAIQHGVHDLNRIGWVCLFASAIALAVWTRRVAQNARRRGVPRVSVTAATFSWFIPLFGIRRGIDQLRLAVRSVDYSDHRLTRWLWTAYINFFIALFTQFAVTSSWASATDFESRMRSLDISNQVLVLVSLWSIVAAVCATVAILHADRAVSSTR